MASNRDVQMTYKIIACIAYEQYLKTLPIEKFILEEMCCIFSESKPKFFRTWY